MKTTTSDADKAEQRWLTRGVSSVSLASFFSDSGHEIATAVLPSFLTTVLHSSAAALGGIEGFSDALTGVAKMAGGPLANDARWRQRLATGGYLGTAAATGAIGVTVAVWQAGALRAFAWASRGLRSPARDTLLATLAPPTAYGRAYGLERAGDNLGAVAGPLLAAGLVAWLGIRPAIYFAFVPGIFAALAITIAAREARGKPREVAGKARLHLSAIRESGIARALAPVACFEFGNVAATLLILRATQLLTGHGRTPSQAASVAILIYAAHNVSASVLSLGAGRWVDRVGPRPVFAAGAGVYVIAYAGFAADVTAWWWLLVSFILAGAGIGFAETAESALVAISLPDAGRGSGFGLLGAVQALGDLIATVVAGVLYTSVSASAGFIYAACWMLVAVLISTATRRWSPSLPSTRTGVS